MKVFTIIAAIIGVLALLVGLTAYNFKPSENKILDFLVKNPDKTAIKLVRNDSLIAERNGDEMMPLASTVKIILAIEYAEQAAIGKVDPDEEISLEELEKFHVVNTDGGAHARWLKSVESKCVEGQISIREIAKGMIRYSSNANTEWLSKRLGLDKINSRLDSLGMVDHSEIYYIVSALFVGKELFPELKGKKLEDKLRSLSEEEYIGATNVIQEKLLVDTTYKKDVGDLSMGIQRVWSDNLPSSTVNEYRELMKKINSRTYFAPEVHEYLNEVLEGVMENPANQKWLKHSGMKGGSTAFVLTKALYATDKKGNTTELTYFFNDLGFFENMKLQSSMNQFELKVLTDGTFRERVKKSLNNEGH